MDTKYDILAYTILILINSDDVIMPQWSWIWNIIVFHNLSNLGPYNPNIKYWASYASDLFYWNYDIVAWYDPELKIWYLICLDTRHLINWKMGYCPD